jgi:hypothetical protein
MSSTHSIVISDSSDNYIEIINHDIDPNMWIVKRSKKIFLFFKKIISSTWFNKKDDALRYAEDLKNMN